MDKTTWQEVLSLCDEIEELLRTAAPVADTARLRRIEFLCARMQGQDPYISEKAGNLASRAGIYLSARKHATHQGGSDGLMQDMRYSLLGAIREQARWLQRSEK